MITIGTLGKTLRKMQKKTDRRKVKSTNYEAKKLLKNY